MDEKTIKDWRKCRRISLLRLPIEAGLLVALCLVIYVVKLFIYVPVWLAAVLIGMAAFSVAGDAINVIYLGWKLRGIDQNVR
jgi:hypothetical protein